MNRHQFSLCLFFWLTLIGLAYLYHTLPDSDLDLTATVSAPWWLFWESNPTRGELGHIIMGLLGSFGLPLSVPLAACISSSKTEVARMCGLLLRGHHPHPTKAGRSIGWKSHVLPSFVLMGLLVGKYASFRSGVVVGISGVLMFLLMQRVIRQVHEAKLFEERMTI